MEYNKFNQFTSMPYIPYRIIEYLISNNENIWKVLKYPTYDCLSQPNLTLKEKAEMIWKNQDRQQDYNVFLNPIVNNMIYDATTILKCYRLDSNPVNHIIATVSYEFDIIYGSKIPMIGLDGVPCTRGDVIEMELMKTLNGADVSGVGLLQYNTRLSGLCRSRANVGNDNTFNGISLIFAVQVGDLDAGC